MSPTTPRAGGRGRERGREGGREGERRNGVVRRRRKEETKVKINK